MNILLVNKEGTGYIGNILTKNEFKIACFEECVVKDKQTIFIAGYPKFTKLAQLL